MTKNIALIGGLLYSMAVLADKPAVTLQPSNDRYMSNLTQLTLEGDNGEAYFSFDGRQLIYQSNRGGYQCDKIWTMDIDGSNKKMVSPDHGAHTRSFFYPGARHIVFASTSHLAGACPPKPNLPSDIHFYRRLERVNEKNVVVCAMADELPTAGPGCSIPAAPGTQGRTPAPTPHIDRD